MKFVTPFMIILSISASLCLTGCRTFWPFQDETTPNTGIFDLTDNEHSNTGGHPFEEEETIFVSDIPWDGGVTETTEDIVPGTDETIVEAVTPVTVLPTVTVVPPVTSSTITPVEPATTEHQPPAHSNSDAFGKDYPLGVIGEIEVVHIPGFSVPFEARIDTGATTSSLDARDITPFERDGKTWVSFKIVERVRGTEKKYELPVLRVVRIKRHGYDSGRRYTVPFTFRIGHLTIEREFTLTDRSTFKYPILLGRNAISGLGVVDPSRRNAL